MLVEYRQQHGSKLIIAAVSASLTTLSLFYLMKSLIALDDLIELDPVADIPLVEFVRLQKETLVETTRNKPTPPPQVKEKPSLPDIAIAPSGDGYSGNPPPKLVIKGQPEIAAGPTDGGVMQLVAVQPTYPRTAANRGIEGYVIVEFDVAADGSVRNPRVIENAPSNIFDKAAVNAVLKFRYKPKVRNGVAIPVAGIRNRFTFNLSRDT